MPSRFAVVLALYSSGCYPRPFRTPREQRLSARPFLFALLLPLVFPFEASSQVELSLEQCRRTARNQHPDTAIARSLSAAAKARRAIAFAGYLPNLTADGSYVASRGSGGASTGFSGPRVSVPAGTVTEASRFFGPAEVEIWGGSLSLRQTIWDFGRTTNRYEATVAASRQSLARQQLVEELVDLAAEATFRAALASGDLVAAMEESRRQAQAHLDLARGRAEVGLSAPYDVVRAEVEVANAEVRVIQATNAMDLTHAELATACGMERLPEQTVLVPAPPRAPIPIPSLDEAMEEAMRSLPEIREAQAAVEVAAQELDLAWSQLYPDLGLTGSVGLRGKELGDLQPGWTALVSVTVPIVNGGADLGLIRERRANLAAAEASFTNVTRGLRLDLQGGILGVQEASARLAAAEKKEAAAAEGLRLAEGRFQTGLGSALELADAQSQLASARAEKVQSSLDLSVSLASLERLLGRWGTHDG